MNRAEVLDTAMNYVTEDRAADHGNLEDNFRTIADLWSVYLNADIRPHDVGVMMTLLKVARIRGNPNHADNFVDGAGYMACAAECVKNE